MPELSKNYDPKSIERDAAACWAEKNLFHAEPTDPGEPFAMVIPPPNVTAALHLGHALNNTLQDILVRWRRMAGDNAVWLPGTDHAGIATQTVVEKRVLKEEGKRRTEFGRDEFVAKIQAWKDEYEQVILGQLKAMGASCDWERNAFTMDEPRAAAVREGFFQLFKAGLIYRGKRLVNWDPATLTALADDEVEMEDVDGFFYYLKYPLEDGGGHITVATTRPETMLGDTAVAMNRRDPRYAELKDKKIKLPIVGRVIPIIEDDYVVMADPNGDDPKAKFATGFLKVTPAHDPNDYEIGLRHALPVINVMAPDASISDKHGWTDIGDAAFVLGQSREAARESIVEWFRRHGLLEDVKPYRHAVGHSYRSHVAIEPYLSDQWYCKVTDDRLAGAALRAVNESVKGLQPLRKTSDACAPEGVAQGLEAPATGLTFHPARYAKSYSSWLENIRDWCISRQLWWGHRIPVWTLYTHNDCGGEALLRQFADYFALAGASADVLLKLDTEDDCVLRIVTRTARADRCVAAMNIFFTRTGDRPLTREDFSDLGLSDNAWALALSIMGGPASDQVTQDPDVLDTWFSSGLWPLSTLGWPQQSTIDNPQSLLNVWNPTSVLSTAREIITLWVSRMVMFNLFFTGRLPFKDVYIHAIVQDGDGRKMSKSLGNGVDPLDIIATHGTDAMRFTLCTMATNTQDVRLPVERDPATGKNTSTKFDQGRNVCNKLWNAARFVLMQLEKSTADGQQSTAEDSASLAADRRPPTADLTLADRWIISRLNRTITEIESSLREYRFDTYSKTLYDFFWRDFCDWYVECTKPQMRDEATKATTANVLAAVLDASLRLMHPVLPFITEILWWKLNETRPSRGVKGLVVCPQPGDKLGRFDRYAQIIRAPFPIAGPTNDVAEAEFGKVREIIEAIRNARSTSKVDPKKTLSVSIKTNAEAEASDSSTRSAIETLAACTVTAIGADVSSSASSTKLTVAAGEIYIEGLSDPVADQARNAKRREELTKAVAALQGRLANPAYANKAPAKLVQETKDQLAAATAELAGL